MAGRKSVVRAAVGLSVLLAAGFLPLLVRPASAQYFQLKLVADTPHHAFHSDQRLANPWGLAFLPNSPFWISDNRAGLSTLYRGLGWQVPPVVTVPATAGSKAAGSPTGIVANSTDEFALSEGGKSGSALLIFDTLDGTISGWSPLVDPTRAIVLVDNSQKGSIYTGLAAGANNGRSLIYAVDAGNGRIEMYDGNLRFAGFFRTDPNLPAGFVPYGIQNINGSLYVTFVDMSSSGMGDGYVDVYDSAGRLVRRFASEGTLNFPWGVARAPADFGKFSNDILVGNVADGHVSAFDPNSGAFQGLLTNIHGNPLAVPGLWSLVFGAGSEANGPKNWLFFTAGPNRFTNGLFGAIIAFH